MRVVYIEGCELMGFNLFRNQIDSKYDELYETLDAESKLLVDLYVLLTLNKDNKSVDFDISHEIVYDPNTKGLTARYVVDVPVKPIK